LSSPLHQLSIDISLIHQHITFTASSTIRSKSSPVVCLSVCRRVVLAPLHLCSSLNMFAASHSQAHLYTQKIATIETASITMHQYLYEYHYVSLFVLISIHINTDLSSVHVAPITLSILDILATAFQRLAKYGYRDHTYIDIYRCIYIDLYMHSIMTRTSSLSISSTLSFVHPLVRCFSLLRCSVFFPLVHMCFFLLLCLLYSVSVLVSLYVGTVFSRINLFASNLAFVFSFSTIPHSTFLTELALLPLSILDFPAALNKKESVNRRKPYILCPHPSDCPLLTFPATIFMSEETRNKEQGCCVV